MDGPAPVNTTASLSAGADEDITVRQQKAPPINATAVNEPEGHPLGSYAGVVPGASTPPAVPVARGETKPVITWPGFQMRQDGTSRVFIQSTTALTPQSSSEGARFTVFLPGAKVAGNTNRLPLETRFFNTPVSRVNIEVQRGGVSLVLDMRAEISPIVSSERGPAGYYFLYIDLPKGSFVKTPAPPSPEAQPSPADERARPSQAAKSATVSGDASAHGKAAASATTGEAKASTKANAKGTIKLGL